MNKDTESRLKNLRLIDPTEGLKGQVTSAATTVWHESSTDVAWWIPIRQLGIAAVVTLAVVWLADYAGDQAATERQPVNVARVSKPAHSTDDLRDATSGLFVERVIRFPRQVNVLAIRQHQQQVRQILDEQVREVN